MSARIMLIEDDPDNAQLVAWMLEDQGYEFECFRTAEEGLGALGKGSFDLVLMDICLPGMNGKEATRLIRAGTRFTNLPVVAVTAQALKGQDQAILESGVTELITKPIDESELIETIESHLTKAQEYVQDSGC